MNFPLSLETVYYIVPAMVAITTLWGIFKKTLISALFNCLAVVFLAIQSLTLALLVDPHWWFAFVASLAGVYFTLQVVLDRIKEQKDKEEGIFIEWPRS